MKGSTKRSTLSLLRQFKPGDRVKRYYHGEPGSINMYEGIIMTVNHDQLEIYWDKIDGVYCPNLIENDFTICNFDEVRNGNQEFSALKQKKLSFFH
jgi:hypothetical protein